MGNHSVGQTFHLVFKTIEKSIPSMSKEELLVVLDTVGNEFRRYDAEFDDYTNPEYPLGQALIKIFNPEIGAIPDDESESEQWWNRHYETVYRPFQARYDFC